MNIKLTTNPVQRKYIEYFEEHFNHNTDDIYDIANFVAALRKYANFLEQEPEDPLLLNDLKTHIEEAMVDWPGVDNTKFRPTPQEIDDENYQIIRERIAIDYVEDSAEDKMNREAYRLFKNKYGYEYEHPLDDVNDVDYTDDEKFQAIKQEIINEDNGWNEDRINRRTRQVFEDRFGYEYE